MGSYSERPRFSRGTGGRPGPGSVSGNSIHRFSYRARVGRPENSGGVCGYALPQVVVGANRSQIRRGKEFFCGVAFRDHLSGGRIGVSLKLYQTGRAWAVAAKKDPWAGRNAGVKSENPSQAAFWQAGAGRGSVPRRWPVVPSHYCVRSWGNAAATSRENRPRWPILPLATVGTARYSIGSKPAGPLPQGTLTSAGFSLRGGWK